MHRYSGYPGSVCQERRPQRCRNGNSRLRRVADHRLQCSRTHLAETADSVILLRSRVRAPRSGAQLRTAFPKTMEQEADCWGINALFTAHRIRMRDVAVIQGDISRAGRGDWTHLPGPVRATNLRRCIESEGEPDREVAAPPPPPRTFCCDSWGRKRCEIPPMRAGSPCYCVGIPGVGSACY